MLTIRILRCTIFCLISLALSSCASLSESYSSSSDSGSNYASGEKTIVVDPIAHRFTAYDAQGNVVRTGLASAGSDYCTDLDRECHTRVGTFRIRSLGDAGCKSPSFPLPKGGAAMPYCMYFNDTQALHGVPESKLGNANLSHGCVRLHTSDAAWLRYNFAEIGTKVVVEPY